MKRMSVAALVVLATSSLGSSANAQAKSDSDILPKSLVGCWHRRSKEPQIVKNDEGRMVRVGPTEITYCFKRSGKATGFAFDHLDGWDFPGNWRLKDAQLIADFGEEHRFACKFSLSAEQDALTLTDCDPAGTYKKKERSTWTDYMLAD